MATINYAALAKDAAKGQEPLPVGAYEVEVTGAEHKVAASGNPYYKTELTVAAGPHKGRKLWNNITLNASNPNSVGYFFGTMRTLGLDAEFFADLPGDESEAAALICTALVGRQVVATVKHGEYNGNVTNEVDKLAKSSAALSGTPSVEPAAPATSSGLPPGL